MKKGWFLIPTLHLLCCNIATSSRGVYRFYRNMQAGLSSSVHASSVDDCAVLCSEQGSQCTCFHHDATNGCYFLNSIQELIPASASGYDLYCEKDIPVTMYLGCYGDTGFDRDMPASVSPSSLLTPQVCIADCRSLDNGYLYAGVQNGGQCFCGTTYGKHGTVTNCNKACPGDSTTMCGGFDAQNIYVILDP
ncbi:unnamed protein product [Owenia fusiformis]|uniref:Uncharacterized protein n=1 Tax=Owenia fusiformis TaxID=6347 RepID=A0A8J1TEQ1_OWEFU|nr:unnamed protein product [Owenia fusiformis]